MSPYEETVIVNERIVELVREYQKTATEPVHLEIFNLLLPVTSKTISKVLSHSGLPDHLSEDMMSDAFPRLHWAILYFKEAKNPTLSNFSPVFINYWKVCLRNELIRKYQGQWRHKELPENYDHAAPVVPNPYDALLLKEIREFVEDTIRPWKNQRQKSLVLALLEERVFRLDTEKTFQKDLASRFGIQSGVVSQWQLWLEKEIKEKFADEE